MKTLNVFSLAVLLLIGSGAAAQTGVIAHRSHSGSMCSFNAFSMPDNLGLPPMSLDSIIWLSDTSVVEISSMGNGWHRITDTVVHHPYCNNPAIGYDSLKTYYPYYVQLVGFDTTKKSEPVADSLAKQRERIKSDEERKKNSTPLVPVNTDNNTPLPDATTNLFGYFITAFFGCLAVVGFLIWFTGKKQIALP
ncbi:MAG: hypothetical protein HYZ14_02935 [Bacteroidetes bacterium]|nr:hypothetical protein [Bacteroidota bacterium]